MAQATSISSPHSIPRTRIRSPSPSNSISISPNRYSTSPRLNHHRINLGSSSSPRQSSSRPSSKRSPSSDSKENDPIKPEMDSNHDYSSFIDGEDINSTASNVKRSSFRSNGTSSNSIEKDLGNGGGRIWRDGSIEPSPLPQSQSSDNEIRQRKAKSPSTPTRNSSRKSPTSPYSGLPFLPTIPADEDLPETPTSPSRPPPPAPSAAIASDPNRPITRQRRSSSIKRKPSPGVTPQKVVDWEIPRKTLHSSIGFLTLFLYFIDPPTIWPLVQVLSLGLAAVLAADFLRLNFPAFAELWEAYLGFLMRESERNKINGVVWYLVGVIFVLSLYPRDVAVVSILTLSWSDTTASTIGRLWGRYTPPLPSHLPFIPAIKFAPRKSLAGFLAATITGFLIALVFWHKGSNHWAILDPSYTWSGLGLWVSSLFIGLGGAVVEALDLGLDDNLTLPILSGALMWAWFGFTNVLLGKW